MKEKNLSVFDFDLVEAVVSGKKDEVKQNIHDVTKEMVNMLMQRDFENLSKQFEKQKNKLAYLVAIENKEDDIHYTIGKYIGRLEALDEFFREYAKEEKLNSFFKSLCANEISLVHLIVYILSNNSGIRIEKIEEGVAMCREDTSLIPKILEKMMKCDLVSYYSPGKFKYYFLTNMGKLYCKKFV